MIKLSTASDTTSIAITIYNEGFGAVKETRVVNLNGNEDELVFSDVAQLIETNSLLVEGINVLEFNYDYDLVGREKLLKKYIDKDVVLKDRTSGRTRECRLLSVEGSGNSVLEDKVTKEIYIDTQSELILPSLPSNLIVKPALVWRISPAKTDIVNVSYLSQGLNWIANYVVELQESTLNIAGWAEIENISGTTFNNAKVKLIAGDVNRVNNDSDKNMSLARVYDYHMYTVKSTTTLKNNQTKQINILNGVGIAYRKYYRLKNNDDKVNVIVEFANKEYALPKGTIKLYMVDKDDSSLEFIGEDTIDHTPKDENIILIIGNAFDITFTYAETNKKKIGGYEYYTYEYVITNHKEESVEVHFDHYILGIWDIVSSTHEFIKKTSNLIEYIVNISANSEAKIVFEYKVDKRNELIIQ